MNLRLLPLVCVALLAACSGTQVKQRDQQQLERFLQYAGPPVKEFTYLGRYDSWQAVGPNQLVLWTTPSDAYLITASQPCENLQFVNRMGLTSTGNTVYSGLDSVLVRGLRCTISEIRRIDSRHMREDLRREHAEQKAQKSGGS